MAGIYIHIPFCRKKCHYCDFYKTTDISSKLALLNGLRKELMERNTELDNEIVETVYFGGGTPSILKSTELKSLLEIIQSKYKLIKNAEITLEANPDDLALDYLSEIKSIGFNRISMGIQSFSEPDLKLMNRRHNVSQAIQAVTWAKEAGFENISIDLIYGLPNQNLEQWMNNVQKAIDLNVCHISAYHLTYHDGTVFHDRLRKGVFKELTDELSLKQFKVLVAMLEANGFIHYEISNFAKKGYFSKHNSAYWKNKKYMGIGPSSHSFNINTRRWNISDVNKYINGIESGEKYWDEEVLSIQDKFNDYIITNLRTTWGISIDFVKTEFPLHYYDHLQNAIQKHLKSDLLCLNKSTVTLTSDGLFMSDRLMTDLMYVE